MTQTATQATTQAAPAQPIGSAADAETTINHLVDVMDGLLGIVQEETTLVRSGKLAAATRLEPAKHELSQAYLGAMSRLKTSQQYLMKAMPDVLKALRQRHEMFRVLLQMNLTVLATAHAVSESIMRGVSNELARKATPQGYAASGRSMMPAPSHMQPLAVSRVL